MWGGELGKRRNRGKKRIRKERRFEKQTNPNPFLKVIFSENKGIYTIPDLKTLKLLSPSELQPSLS